MAYAPPEGVPRLREQIVADLSSRGVPATADDILVTSGSQQAIDLIALCIRREPETLRHWLVKDRFEKMDPATEPPAEE